MSDSLRLNIGAGVTFIPGFVNIDIASCADVQIDIGKDQLPFDDNSVDLVFSHHTLEHVPEYLFALGEIYRVLKHGGHLLLGVPYVTLTEYNLVNPYHKNHFNEYSFDFFDPARLKGSAAEENSITLKKVFHRFHYMDEFRSVSEPKRTWYRRHLFNVVREIDFGLVAIKDHKKALSWTKADEAKMLENFDLCLRSRKLY